MTLHSKTALVTGASGGIGRAIALKLASQGAFVHLHFSSTPSAARETLSLIENAGGRGALVGFDLADLDAITAAAAGFDALDILVNNAGVASFAPLGHIPPTEFEAIFNVNVRGLFFLTQTLLYKINDGGRIVNISSGITRVNAASGSVYAASKCAVEAFSRAWAAELGPRKITVNTVSPGMTATELLFQVTTQKQLDDHVAQTPLGRLGQPEDIADVVAFLCSDEARWVTANNLLANGGVG